MDKIFEVSRHRNNRGNSHLLVVTEPVLPDLVIGTVAIIPYADGFIDPVKVRLLVDENEKPVRANEKFAVVLEHIYG